MTEETFTDYYLKAKRTKRNQSESKSDVKPSNSDTLIEIKHEKENKSKDQEEVQTETNHSCMNILPKHKHCAKCKICHNFQRILKKDKSALSKYIQNNLQFLKLIGNQRYNQNSPSLFVEDYNSKLSQETMGLLPIPDKKVKANSINNNKKLYNLQRSIVMIRRFQYETKSNMKEIFPKIEHDIILIQKWWRRISKIIMIQKIYKGYFIRKQISSIINLHRFMQNFENFIHFLQIKYFFQKMFRSIVIPKKRKPIKGNYISKKKALLSNKTFNNIISIQNNFRKLKAKNKYFQLLKENKFKVKNRIEYCSKKYYVTNGINEKITMIQFNFRKYLRSKYYIERKIVHKNIGIYFIDKNYIDYYSKKIISFYKLIDHGLKLKAIQKIRTKYKKFDKYNKDDINNIIFIQKKFLKYFYGKNPKKIIRNKKTKKVCFFDKIRLKENINKIKLIQKIYRKYNIRKTKLKNKLIRNKPISSSSKRKISTPKNHNKNKNNNKVPKKLSMNIKGINFSNKNKIKKRNDNLLEYKRSESNERLINNICYISKEIKINHINKIILLQRKIFSYIFIKKLRNNNIPKFIIKKDYNLCFFITKTNTNENHCINNIKKIQKMYKTQYKYMKNNIIEYINTKSSNESGNNNLNNNNYSNQNSKKNKIKANNYLNERNNDNNYNNKYYVPYKNNHLIPNGNNGNMKDAQQNYKYYNSYYTKNDKYYTKYNKNDNINGNMNTKRINRSLSQIELKKKDSNKDKLTLRELIKKNKTPKKEIKGYYISKKRVEKNKIENYLNFNKHIQHQIIKNPIYITKSRYYNNEQKIKKIQNFFKKILSNNINIIRKPFTNVGEIKAKDNKTIIDNFKNKRKNNNYFIDNKKNTFNFTPKNLFIKKNNNANINNSSRKKTYIKRYDTDDLDDNKNNNNYNGGIIDNKLDNYEKNKSNNYTEMTKFKINNGINNEINNILENKNYGNYSSNYNYISKIRKINILKYILLLQKNIRISLNKNMINYYKRIECGYLFISKVRINIKTYNKYIKYKNESNQIIKIPKKYNQNKTSGFYNKNNIQKNKLLLNKIKSNEIIVDEDDDNYNSFGNNNRINSDINFISKIRYINYEYFIKKIQKNWRIRKNNKLNIIKKPKTKNSYIIIKRFKNNLKQISLIQKIYKIKLSKRKDEKSKIISRKSLFDSINKQKSSIKQYNKSKSKSKSNNDNKISIKDINLINKMFQNNIKSQNNKNNKNKINEKQNLPNKNFEYNIINNKSDKIYKLSRNNSNKYSEENSSRENNGKKGFSFADVNYISKIYKVIIFKKDINIKGIYFISKESKKIIKNKYDLSFVSLLNLFLTKNCQEYIFYLLKYNTKKSFKYPFYNKTLHRVLNFIRSNPPDIQGEGGEKIKKFLNKIFPELHSKKTNTILISSLSPESKKQLVNTNIYNSIETDFINYICSFSKYDKHLSNPTFIKTRLKNTKLLNTNIFNITKFIDDEYNNLINGKYCLKCYLDLNKCICNKKKIEEETSFLEDDDALDIDFGNDYSNRKNSEYDSIKCKGITINRKPKAEEVYEDPITCLISHNKDEYLDCNKQIINFKNCSINISGSQYWSNSSSRTNFNSRTLNRIKNNVENENNSLNNSKNIAKIKAIYHQNNNSTKKENTILIKNNDHKNGS